MGHIPTDSCDFFKIAICRVAAAAVEIEFSSQYSFVKLASIIMNFINSYT